MLLLSPPSPRFFVHLFASGYIPNNHQQMLVAPKVEELTAYLYVKFRAVSANVYGLGHAKTVGANFSAEILKLAIMLPLNYVASRQSEKLLSRISINPAGGGVYIYNLILRPIDDQPVAE
jgi:hypothetical protein